MSAVTKKSSVCVILAVLWGLFIFANSLQNGETSTKLSDAVVFRLPGWLEWLDLHTLTVLVRKSAHFCEYAVLAALLCLAFYYSGALLMRNMGNLLFPCLLWAVLDEFLQTFVEGRTGLVSDVLIDFCGIVTGCLVLLAWLWVYKRVRRRKRKS